MRFHFLTPDLVPHAEAPMLQKELLGWKITLLSPPGAEPQPPLVLAEGECQVGSFTGGGERTPRAQPSSCGCSLAGHVLSL